MTLILLLAFTVPPQDSLRSFPEIEFKQLHDALIPKPGEEAWEAIPWVSNLNLARKRAVAEGKPILLWEMDGHPLGCT